MKSVANKTITIALTIFATLATIGFAAPLFATSLPGAQIVQTKITVGDTSQPFAIADTNYLQGGHMQVPHVSDMYAITPQRRSTGMLVTVTDNNGDSSNHSVTYRLIKNPIGGAGCPASTGYVSDNSLDGLDEPSSCTTTQASDWIIVIPDITSVSSGLVFATDGSGNVVATTTGGGSGLTGVTFSMVTNPNGGSLSGSTLVLAAADSSNPGLVSTSSQTFSGSKTFMSAPSISPFTSGSIPFIGSSGILSQNNSNFFWDNTNNRLGIGTNTPGSALEVVGNIISKGTSWTARTSPFANSWKSVAYGDGRFVAVATTATANDIMISSDGINWTPEVAPVSNTWDAITYGNGLFVAVAFSSATTTSVMTSPDGINWTTHAAPSSQRWNSIAYGNGMFVAIADSSVTCMTSPDGVNWTARSFSSSAWQSMTYGNGKFVAVSYNGNVMTSPDGISWTSQTPASLGQWTGVAYGNGLFVAVAASSSSANDVMTSPDGVTWTNHTGPANLSYFVTYGNGLFVAGGSFGQLMTSPDGVNWTSRTSTVSTSLGSAVYGNGMFVALAYTGSTSTQIITSGSMDYSSVQNSNNNNYQGGINVYGNDNFFGAPPVATSSGLLSIGDGSFVAGALNSFNGSTAGTDIALNTATSFTGNLMDLQVGGNSKMKVDYLGNLTLAGNATIAGTLTASSATFNSLEVDGDIYSKGTKWTARTAPVTSNLYDVAYGNGMFVSVAYTTGTTTDIATSPDGINWTARNAPNTHGWQSITYGNGEFVAVSFSGGDAITSVDGINWTSHPLPSLTTQVTGVAYGNGKFVAMSAYGSPATSPDGITWTAQTPSTYNLWYSVTYGNGLFVAVSEAGSTSTSIMTSPNGVTWTTRTIPEPNQLYDVTYGNGKFVSVGAAGTHRVMTSLDGITWTGQSVPVSASSDSWYGVTYGNGLFVAFSGSGSDYVMTSPDGVTWTIRPNGNQPLAHGVYGNGMFVAVGPSGPVIMTSGFSDYSSTQNNNIYQGGITVNGNDNFFGAPPVATSSGLLSIGDGSFVAGALNSFSGSATGTYLALNTATSFTGNLLDLQVGGNSKMKIDATGNMTLAGALTTTSITDSGLAVGPVVFGGAGGALTQNTNFFWNNTTARLGIGTNTPGSALEVVGNIISKGTSWTSRASTATAGKWRSVAYGNGLFVAVENNGPNRVMTSPDGINWTTHPSAPSGLWSSVTYGNGLFVAVEGSGASRVMTSPDGITWTAHSSAPAGSWQAVTYGNGLFVALESAGANHVMTSPDGITWTARSSAPSGSWSSIAYGNGYFAAVENNSSGSNHTMSSPDGITWTAHSSTSPAGFWQAVTYGNGLFVAVEGSGGGSHVMTSPDGTNWTAHPAGLMSLGSVWWGVAYGNGLFVAVDTSGANVATSPDGINWTIRTSTSPSGTWESVTYGNGMFVSVENNASGSGVVMTSGAPDYETVQNNNNYQGGVTVNGNDNFFGSPTAVNSSGLISIGDGGFAGAAGNFQGSATGTYLALNATSSFSGDLINLEIASSSKFKIDATGNMTNAGSINAGGGGFVYTSGSSPTFLAKINSFDIKPATATSGAPTFLHIDTSTSTTGNVTIGDSSGVNGGVFGIYKTAGPSTWYASIKEKASGAGFNNYFDISPSTNTYYLGDANLAYNGTFINIDDTAGSETVSTRSNAVNFAATSGVAYFQADTNNKYYKFGDIGGTYGSGNYLDIEDSGASSTTSFNAVIASAFNIKASGISKFKIDATGNMTLPNTVIASSSRGLVSIGDQGFAGAVNNFSGSASGTVLAMNTAVSFTGNLLDLQVGGNSKLKLSAYGNMELSGNLYSKGVTWASRSGVLTSAVDAITYGNGLFVAVAQQGATTTSIETSPDGIRWTAATAPTVRSLTSVTYGNGLFVAVGNSTTSTNEIITSPDGVTWTARTAPVIASWNNITYGKGKFVATNNNNTNAVMYSNDGINWNTTTPAATTTWSGLTYGNGLFVAVASDGATSTNIMTSPDGITWTNRTSPSVSVWDAITYGNGLFVAGAEQPSGTNIMTSTNGITWIAASISIETSAIAYGNGLFVTTNSDPGGGSGIFSTSPDGVTWTQRNVGSGKYVSIAYGNGTFVGAAWGSGGAITTSGSNDYTSVQNNNIYQGGITVNGNDNFFGAPPVATSSGLLSIGDGSFVAGALNSFNGSTAGTDIALNTATSFTGNLMDLQVGGSSKFKISATGALTDPSFSTNGGLLYANSSGVFSQTATGTANQVLISNGGGAPTWFNPTIGSVLFADYNGALATSSSFYWDPNTSRLGIGTNTPSAGIVVHSASTSTAVVTSGTSTQISINPASPWTGASGVVTVTIGGVYLTGIAGFTPNSDYFSDSASTSTTDCAISTGTGGVGYLQAQYLTNGWHFSPGGTLYDHGPSGCSGPVIASYTLSSSPLDFNDKTQDGGLLSWGLNATSKTNFYPIASGSTSTSLGLDIKFAVLPLNNAGDSWTITVNSAGVPSPMLKVENNVSFPVFTVNDSYGSASSGMLTLGNSSFSGSATGTILALSATSTFTGDIINLQVGGVSKMKVDALGNITDGDGTHNFFTINSTTKKYGIGDINSAASGTSFVLTDTSASSSALLKANNNFTVSDTSGHSYLLANAQNGLYQFGDINSASGGVAGNNNYLSIDDTRSLTRFYGMQQSGIASSSVTYTPVLYTDNDFAKSGTYTGSGSSSVTYTVTIDGNTDGFGNITASSGTWNVGDTVTINNTGTGTTTGKFLSFIGSSVFLTNVVLSGNSVSGTSIKDVTSGATATSDGLSNTSGIDTFTWTDGVTTVHNVSASVSPVALNNGISVNWTTASYHSYGDFWSWTYNPRGITLSLDALNKSYKIGDTNNVYGGSVFTVGATTSSFRMTATSSLFTIGDISGAHNFFSINTTGDVYSIGDLNTVHNGSYLQLDDYNGGATSGVVTIHNANLVIQGTGGTACTLGNGVVATSGQITAGTGAALYCSSDARLKTNITELSTSTLDKINQLKPVTFNWNSDPDGTPTIGFIAQDMQKVYPEFVNINDPKTGYLGVNYAGLVAPIVAAIQEMDLKLEPLTSLDPTQDNSLASLIKTYLANALNGIQSIFAAKVQTHELCLDEVCVTKDQLQQLLNQAAVPPVIIGPELDTSTTTSSSTDAGLGGGGSTITSTSTTSGTDTSTSTSTVSDSSASSTTSGATDTSTTTSTDTSASSTGTTDTSTTNSSVSSGTDSSSTNTTTSAPASSDSSTSPAPTPAPTDTSSQ